MPSNRRRFMNDDLPEKLRRRKERLALQEQQRLIDEQKKQVNRLRAKQGTVAPQYSEKPKRNPLRKPRPRRGA